MFAKYVRFLKHLHLLCDWKSGDEKLYGETRAGSYKTWKNDFNFLNDEV